MSDNYGESLIVDLIECNGAPYHRNAIEQFCKELCLIIGMEREDLHFWDYHDEPDEYRKAPNHLKGTSVVQFISTSSLVVHALDVTGQVFIDLFSCKPFDHEHVANFAAFFFKGKIHAQHSITRG